MVGPSTVVINLVQQKQTSRLKCLVLRLLTSDLGSLFYMAKRPSETWFKAVSQTFTLLTATYSGKANTILSVAADSSTLVPKSLSPV